MEELVSGRAAESQHLEFKSILPGRSDKDRHEFLKDIAAIANADGGTIIFGISEQKGVAHALSPLAIEDKDLEDRRLLQMLDSGIEPRLAAVSTKWIDSDSGIFLVLDVEKSYSGPHRFSVNGQSKFVVRNNTHVTEMSYLQLASSFKETGSKMDLLDQQWNKWCMDGETGRTYRPIAEGPFLVCGFVPLISSERVPVADLNLAYSNYAQMIGSRWGGASSRFSYDGLAIFHGYSEPVLGALAIVSRFGSIISYEEMGHTYEGQDIVPPDTVGKIIMERIGKCIDFAKILDIRGPYFLYCSLVRMGGYKFITPERFHGYSVIDPPMDRIDFPRVWIDDLQAESNLDEIIRPWMDLLWQTVGFSACPHYSDEGKFVLSR